MALRGLIAVKLLGCLRHDIEMLLHHLDGPRLWIWRSTSGRKNSEKLCQSSEVEAELRVTLS